MRIQNLEFNYQPFMNSQTTVQETPVYTITIKQCKVDLMRLTLHNPATKHLTLSHGLVCLRPLAPGSLESRRWSCKSIFLRQHTKSSLFLLKLVKKAVCKLTSSSARLSPVLLPAQNLLTSSPCFHSQKNYLQKQIRALSNQLNLMDVILGFKQQAKQTKTIPSLRSLWRMPLLWRYLSADMICLRQ